MYENNPEAEGRLVSSMDRLRKELDRWMETAYVQGERALDAIGLHGPDRTWMPRVDVTDTPEKVIVDIELAGVDPEAVDITLAGNMLTIKGSKPIVPPAPGETVLARERRGGPFTRSIPMPVPVNADNVLAEARHGLLRIRIAKAEPHQSRPIKVTTTTP
jgi:HSP20 family protein